MAKPARKQRKKIGVAIIAVVLAVLLALGLAAPFLGAFQSQPEQTRQVEMVIEEGDGGSN